MSYSDSAILFPFGKYDGHRLGEIPSSYLQWCRDNCHSLDDGLRDDIKGELARRERSRWAVQRESLRELIPRWEEQLEAEFGRDRKALKVARAAARMLHDLLEEFG